MDIQEEFRRYAAIWNPQTTGVNPLPADQLTAVAAINCCIGVKGRFKASRLEFEIISTTPETSTIRFRYGRQQMELRDTDLKEAAEQIDGFDKDAK